MPTDQLHQWTVMMAKQPPKSTIVVYNEDGPPQNVRVVSDMPMNVEGAESWVSHRSTHGQNEVPDAEVKHRLDWQEPVKVYTAVNKCIYCDAPSEEKALHTEHIFPESLGGRLLLPNSSCHDCAVTIGKFERYCARHIFHDFRQSLGIRGKKGKKKRQNRRLTDDVAFRSNGRMIIKSLPISEIPKRIFIPTPPAPRIILSTEYIPSNVYRFCVFEFYSDEELQMFCNKYGAEDVAIHCNTVKTTPFMRLIAKIAHGFAVAEIGTDRFFPILKPFILGIDKIDYGLFIGTSQVQWTIKQLHYISLNLETHHDIEYWVCRVQLFANYGLPEYVVFVGTNNASHASSILKSNENTGSSWTLSQRDLDGHKSEWVTNSLFVNPHPDNDESELSVVFGKDASQDDLSDFLMKHRTDKDLLD